MLLELKVARRNLLRKLIEIKAHLSSIRSSISLDESASLIINIQNLYIASLKTLQATGPLSKNFNKEKQSMSACKKTFFQKDQKLRNLTELYHWNNKLISERTSNLTSIYNINEELKEINDRLTQVKQDTIAIATEKRKKITNYSKSIDIARIFYQLPENKKELKSKWLLKKELTEIVKRSKNDVKKYSKIIKDNRLKAFEISSGMEQGTSFSSVASNESPRTMSQISLEFEDLNRIVRDSAPDTSAITSKLELSINYSMLNFNEVLDISAVTSSKRNLVCQSSELKINLGRILSDIENLSLT